MWCFFSRQLRLSLAASMIFTLWGSVASAQSIPFITPSEGAQSAEKVYVQVTGEVPSAQIWLNEIKACDRIPCQFASNRGIYKLKAVLTHFDPPYEGRANKIMVKAGLKAGTTTGPEQNNRVRINLEMSSEPVDMSKVDVPAEPATTKNSAVSPPPAAPAVPQGPAPFFDIAPSSGSKGTSKVRVTVNAKIASAKIFVNDVQTCSSTPCHFDMYEGIYHLKVALTHLESPYESRPSKQMIKAGRGGTFQVGPGRNHSEQQYEFGFLYTAVPN